MLIKWVCQLYLSFSEPSIFRISPMQIDSLTRVWFDFLEEWSVGSLATIYASLLCFEAEILAFCPCAVWLTLKSWMEHLLVDLVLNGKHPLDFTLRKLSIIDSLVAIAAFPAWCLRARFRAVIDTRLTHLVDKVSLPASHPASSGWTSCAKATFEINRLKSISLLLSRSVLILSRASWCSSA